MKTFTAYRENVTGDKWKIGWREGDTELCSQTLEVVGEQDAVRQALDANLSVLRERNSSLNLPLVIQAIADLTGKDPGEIEETTWNNARRLYRIH